MPLTTTNAQIFIQDGPVPAVNLTSGSIGYFTPGNLVSFGLQSTAGIQSAVYQFNCPRYAGLHGVTYEWKAGQPNLIQVQMPANLDVNSATSLAGIQLNVTISDGASSIASAFDFLFSKGANNVAMAVAADYVIVAALPAYTATAGTLVGNANGAITSAMADGQTPAVGDTFLLPPGIAGAAVDAGLYTITVVGSGSAKFTAVPAGAWTQGAQVQPNTEVKISKGTVFANTTWVVTNTGASNTVGVTSFTFYPRQVNLSVTLSASGNFAITTVPLLSATLTNVIPVRKTAGGTVTNTIMYNMAAALTPGALGTATTTVQASVAAGTANSADQSVLEVTILNQV